MRRVFPDRALSDYTPPPNAVLPTGASSPAPGTIHANVTKMAGSFGITIDHNAHIETCSPAARGAGVAPGQR
eukprot:SAG11_NODE_4227_length_2001_cov_1.447424_4_plen_71_part_01